MHLLVIANKKNKTSCHAIDQSSESEKMYGMLGCGGIFFITLSVCKLKKFSLCYISQLLFKWCSESQCFVYSDLGLTIYGTPLESRILSFTAKRTYSIFW